MTDTVQLELDGISFELKEPHSFEWIARLGTVFSCV